MKYEKWMQSKFNFFLLTILLVSTATVQGADLQVLYHEPLNIISEQQAQSKIAPQNQNENAKEALSAETLSFDALDQHFELELEPNSRLTEKMAADQPTAGKLRLLRGKIVGNSQSWVRLSYINDQLSGAIWDGKELLIIDSVEDLASSNANTPALKRSKQRIYRLSDTIDPDNRSCALDPHAHQSQSTESYQDTVKHLKKFVPEKAQAGVGVDLAIVTDAEFTNQNGANAQAVALANMNVVDGIYTEQLGVQLNVVSINTLENNGSLSSTDPEILLDQFSSFAAPTNPGLTHLFAGRNIDSNILGIAFLGGVCRPQAGVGISQTNGNTTGALTIAHEIGHNFGAPHDNQPGSACAGSSNAFLMNPFINGSDQFSQCSIAQIQPVLSRASCLTPVDLPDGETPTPPPPEAPTDTVLIDANFDTDINGFSFISDAFRNTSEPAFTFGDRSNQGFTGSALRVLIGGRNNATVRNMSGGWTHPFSLATSQALNLTFKINLAQANGYERDEFSEALINLDGAPIGNGVIARVTGNGNGGGVRSTGWLNVTVNTGILAAGNHSITIGGFNNKKTFNNEITQVLIDDVVLSPQ